MDEQNWFFLACGVTLLWVTSSCFVMLSADKQKKDPLLWFFLSILLTPVFAYVVLLALKNKPLEYSNRKKEQANRAME